MGKFDGIIIYSDVDGTFLGHRSRVIERNLTALEYFRAEGGLFTFASGRMHQNMAMVVPGTEKIANAPAIMANGTYLYDFSAKRALYETFMDGDGAIEMMEYARALFPEVGIRISMSDGFLTDYMNDIIRKDLSSKYITNIVVKPISEWYDINKNWYKIVMRGDAGMLRELRGALEAKFGGRFEFSNSSPKTFEMQSVGCTKASMLNRIRRDNEERNIKLTYICVGDFDNDMAILAAADLAFCPQNALDTVKSICNRCFCENDKGVVADIIEYLDKS